MKKIFVSLCLLAGLSACFDGYQVPCDCSEYGKNICNNGICECNQGFIPFRNHCIQYSENDFMGSPLNCKCFPSSDTLIFTFNTDGVEFYTINVRRSQLGQPGLIFTSTSGSTIPTSTGDSIVVDWKDPSIFWFFDCPEIGPKRYYSTGTFKFVGKDSVRTKIYFHEMGSVPVLDSCEFYLKR